MEYEKLYLKTFEEVHSNTENYIKNKLIEYINKDYGFNKASNEILEESEKKFETNKFNTTNPYTDLIYIFNNERKKYSKNFNENVLKRDVKPAFDNLNIKGYSFEDLIKDLAKYYSETNTYRIFRNHYTLFDLIYRSEDFSEFKIEEFNSDEEYTKTLMKYKNLVFPQSKENNANLNFVEVMNNQDNITNDIGNSPQNNKTKPLKENDNKIILTNEENCLLIFLFKKIISEKGFDTNAEIYKALSLIQVKQLHEFGRKDSYRSSNEYKVIGGKLNNINLNDIDKNNKQLKREYYKLLNKLSNKIKSQKMDKINKEITILTEYIEPQIK